ncbi:hypothetical protein E4U13_006458 [Claviceps humidiphila]|uniref:Uncharacterized protein n=1 Tax=Claviceps humidiphila TaxID=1294629 RepID=A0A9P7PW67_9HYPO|nr:hypothetical protein E4U13_006458 [Claviceps humidiphila]
MRTTISSKGPFLTIGPLLINSWRPKISPTKTFRVLKTTLKTLFLRDSIPLSLPKSTKVKGKRKSLTENLAAPKRAQKASQKKAKGKPTVDKENMSPEMIVAPEKPSAVKRTVNDAKSKGVIHCSCHHCRPQRWHGFFFIGFSLPVVQFQVAFEAMVTRFPDIPVL